jgi:hypothetical protein
VFFEAEIGGERADIIFSSNVPQENVQDFFVPQDDGQVRAEYIFTVYVFTRGPNGQTIVEFWNQGDLKIPFG